MTRDNASENTTTWQTSVSFRSADTVFVVLAVIIVFFNGGVLLAMWKNKILRKPENFLLASLAVSDLSAGFIGLPLSLVCTLTLQSLCAPCYASYAFFKFISITTLLHILVIIRDRYILIIQPILYVQIRNDVLRYKKIVAFLWVLSLIAANIPWFWWNVDCFDAEEETNHNLYYELTSFVLFFIFPLVFIAFFLLKIYFVAGRHIRGETTIRSSLKERRTKPDNTRIFSVLLAMFLIFIICWLPYSVVVILVNVVVFHFPYWVEYCALILRFLTPVVNPVLYTFYKNDFYQILRFEAQKCPRCRKRRQPSTSRHTSQEAVPLESIRNSSLDKAKDEIT